MSARKITCPRCAMKMLTGAMGLHKRICAVTYDELFWAKVDKNGANGCWLWTAAKRPLGYGHYRFLGKSMGSHKYSYEKHFGPVPAGMYVIHSCDVRHCVNPMHLRIGTHLDNMKDMSDRKRHPLWKLSEAQAREILALQGKGPASSFAATYGVNKGAIQAIWRGDTWSRLRK